MEKPIRINVGGLIFTTSLNTLRRYPESPLFLSLANTTGLASYLDEEDIVDENCMQTNSDETSASIGGGSTEDALYFLDRDLDAFADILKYLRHPEAYSPPSDPAFRYLIWCEARFYGVVGITRRLGEVELNLMTGDSSDTNSEITPGLLCALNQIPGCLRAYLARRNAADQPYHVSWSESGVGFPVFDTIIDTSDLFFALPHHHVRLSGIAMSIDLRELGLAMRRFMQDFCSSHSRRAYSGREIILSVCGITADRQKHHLLNIRPDSQAVIRSRVDSFAAPCIGLMLQLAITRYPGNSTEALPSKHVVLILKQIEIYGSMEPTNTVNSAESIMTHAGQEVGIDIISNSFIRSYAGYYSGESYL